VSALGDRLNAIHARLVAGRPTASLDLFEAALDPLIGFLRRQLKLSEEDAYDRAVDAIMTYVHSPEIFDVTKSSLWTFLCLIGQRRTKDVRRAAKKHGRLEEKYGYGIELWSVQANNPSEAFENARDAEAIMSLHGSTIAKNDTERKVLDLFLQGESAVELYAEVMGLGPDDDAPAEVKRALDRIKARLKKVHDEL
jgi:hypothetical protein